MVGAKAMFRQSGDRKSEPGAHSAKGSPPQGLRSPRQVTLPRGLSTVAGAQVKEPQAEPHWVLLCGPSIQLARDPLATVRHRILLTSVRAEGTKPEPA